MHERPNLCRSQGKSVTRRFEADGRAMATLSLAPTAAVTTRVEPETLIAAVRTVNECRPRSGRGFRPGRGRGRRRSGSICKVRGGPRRGAGHIRVRVDLALEARPGSEEKLNVGVGSLVAPLGPPVIVVSGGGGVDREGARCRGRVRVDPVAGLDLEGVGAVGERGGWGVGVTGPEQGATGRSQTGTGSSTPAREENPKVGVGSLVAPEGPESIVVSGGKLSVTLRTRLFGCRRCNVALGVDSQPQGVCAGRGGRPPIAGEGAGSRARERGDRPPSRRPCAPGSLLRRRCKGSRE